MDVTNPEQVEYLRRINSCVAELCCRHESPKKQELAQSWP